MYILRSIYASDILHSACHAFWPWSSFYGQSLKWLFVGVVELFELMEVGMFCMFRGLNIVGSVRNRTISVDPLLQKEKTIEYRSVTS